jgi:hypothetical protein
MKLDRSITTPRRGKYALIKLRVDQPVFHSESTPDHRDMRINPKAVDFGDTPDTDFFVIRLKDKYAEAALRAYAKAIGDDDPEYAYEIVKLARIAADHPGKKMPD